MDDLESVLGEALPEIRLTLLVGSYAQACHLGAARQSTMSESVHAYRHYLPLLFPLPHPSPRNRGWLNRLPWFEAELLPELRRHVRDVLNF